MAEWIDRAAALAILNVRPQTLYAYVSRGRIGMQPDPSDSRRSLYRVDDIEALATRRARGRRPAAIAASTIAWGEPVITTSISTAVRGQLIYRGVDAAALAETATLEQTAELLWETSASVAFAATEQGASRDGAFVALATMATNAPPMLGRSATRMTDDAIRAVAVLADAFCGSNDDVRAGGAVSRTPASRGARAHRGENSNAIHLRLAQTWRLNARGADLIRRVLVLLADHELNASTFAVRVAASTGASMAASLLAGLGALSGPRHGTAADAVAAFALDAARVGVETAVAEWLARDRPLPGFGHPLYSNGDPRARALLDALPEDVLMNELGAVVADATGALPNVDFALAVLTRTSRLPADAPFRLFALARSVGWAAHAMEQIKTGTLIRPRGTYVGTLPAANDSGSA